MIAYIAISVVKTNYLSVPVAFVIKIRSLYLRNLRTCFVIYYTLLLFVYSSRGIRDRARPTNWKDVPKGGHDGYQR